MSANGEKSIFGYGYDFVFDFDRDGHLDAMEQIEQFSEEEREFQKLLHPDSGDDLGPEGLDGLLDGLDDADVLDGLDGLEIEDWDV